MAIVEVRKLYRVGFCDPAGRKTDAKGPRARAAIAVIGQDEFERIFLLSIWADRLPADKLMEKIFWTHEHFQVAIFGVDATATQVIFFDMLQKQASDLGIRIPLRPVDQKMEKTFSIETTLQPIAAGGRLFRPPERECSGLKSEWTTFPNGFYRDQMDAVTNAIKLLPRVLPEHLRALSRDRLRRYLQSTGMSRDQVELQLLQKQD